MSRYYDLGQVRGPVGPSGPAGQDGLDLTVAQTLTATQQAQARENIASPHALFANALRKTVSGTAIRADDVSPLAHGLGVVQYGQCVQDGTPTPAAPIAITGKAAGAHACGRNLFNFEPVTENTYALPLTGSNFAAFRDLPKGILLRYSYTIDTDGTRNVATGNYIAVRYADDTFQMNYTATGLTLKTNTAVASVSIYGAVAGTATHTVFKDFMVSYDSSEYVPYVGATQTITDANGDAVTLYGIPVASGGNVTVDGQQYMADTLDGTTLRRRVGHIAGYNGETVTTAYVSGTGELSTGAEVYYVLETPTTETVTLTPATLAANSPTTTWLSEAYSEVAYNRDSNAAYNELAAAIVALGGTI